jgi:hypothetical protein
MRDDGRNATMIFKQPASSPLLSTEGRGRVFMNGRTHSVTWETTRSEGRVVVFADGRRLAVDDYNEHWGHVSLAPDGEFELIHAMAPIDEDEPDPVGVPNDRELERLAASFDRLLMSRMNPSDLSSSEVGFYRASIADSAVMMRRILRFGDVEAAIRDAVTDD